MRLLRACFVLLLLATSGVSLTACDTDGAANRPPSQDWPPRRNSGGSD